MHQMRLVLASEPHATIPHCYGGINALRPSSAGSIENSSDSLLLSDSAADTACDSPASSSGSSSVSDCGVAATTAAAATTMASSSSSNSNSSTACGLAAAGGSLMQQPLQAAAEVLVNAAHSGDSTTQQPQQARPAPDGPDSTVQVADVDATPAAAASAAGQGSPDYKHTQDDGGVGAEEEEEEGEEGEVVFPPIVQELGVTLGSLQRLLTGGCPVETQQPVWMVVNLQGKIKGSYTSAKMMEFSRRGTLSCTQLILGIDKDLPYMSRQELGFYRRFDEVLTAVHRGASYNPLTQRAVDSMTTDGLPPETWQATTMAPEEGTAAGQGSKSSCSSSVAHEQAEAAAARLQLALMRLCGGSAAATVPSSPQSESPAVSRVSSMVLLPQVVSPLQDQPSSGASGAAVVVAAAAGPQAALAAADHQGGGEGQDKEPLWLYMNHLGWCRGPFPGEKMIQAHLCGRLPRDTLVVCHSPELPPNLLCMDVAYYFRPFGVLLDNVVQGWHYQPVDWQAVSNRSLIKAAEQQEQHPLQPGQAQTPSPWFPLVWRGAQGEVAPPLIDKELLQPPKHVPTATTTSSGGGGHLAAVPPPSWGAAAGHSVGKMSRRRRKQRQGLGLAGLGAAAFDHQTAVAAAAAAAAGPAGLQQFPAGMSVSNGVLAEMQTSLGMLSVQVGPGQQPPRFGHPQLTLLPAAGSSFTYSQQQQQPASAPQLLRNQLLLQTPAAHQWSQPQHDHQHQPQHHQQQQQQQPGSSSWQLCGEDLASRGSGSSSPQFGVLPVTHGGVYHQPLLHSQHQVLQQVQQQQHQVPWVAELQQMPQVNSAAAAAPWLPELPASQQLRAVSGSAAGGQPLLLPMAVYAGAQLPLDQQQLHGCQQQQESAACSVFDLSQQLTSSSSNSHTSASLPLPPSTLVPATTTNNMHLLQVLHLQQQRQEQQQQDLQASAASCWNASCALPLTSLQQQVVPLTSQHQQVVLVSPASGPLGIDAAAAAAGSVVAPHPQGQYIAVLGSPGVYGHPQQLVALHDQQQAVLLTQQQQQHVAQLQLRGSQWHT